MSEQSAQVGGPGAPSAGPGSAWADLAAGSATAESVRALVDASAGELSGAELVDAIVASEKALSLVAASQLRLLTEFARPGRAGDVSGLVESLLDKGGLGHRPDGTLDLDVVQTIVTDRAASLAATEVAAALRISPITAGLRVRRAQDLCEQLPDTVAALAAGRIDRGRAMLIAERTAVLTPALRVTVQNRVMPLAENRSAGNLRGLLDRAVIAADPAAAEEREKKAQRERDLTLLPLPDGMASVKAFAPAAGAVSIFAVADLLAGRTGHADDRPVGARRVDAWVDIAEQLLTYGRVDLSGLLDDPDDPDADHPDTAGTDPAAPDAATPNSAALDAMELGAAGTGVADPGAAAPGYTDTEATDTEATDTEATDTAATDGPAEAGVDVEFGAMSGCDAPNETGSHAGRAHAAAARGGAVLGRRPPASPVSADPTEQSLPAAACSCGGPAVPVPPANRWASRRSRLPHLVVTMSASTWAGMDRLPAHLDGYGAVTAETALTLARSAKSLTAALVDPASGSVLGVGDRVYRPRQAVRDAVNAATETCRFPSCRQPVWRCDLDHRDPFDHHRPAGVGRTSQDNLDPLCRAHHLLKHRTAWGSAPVDGYGREWVSPTGHRYLDPPRSVTLPDEQLTPTPSGIELRSTSTTSIMDRDSDYDPQCPDRPDWREAEFGGDFPDTLNLRVRTTIARQRLHSIRDRRDRRDLSDLRDLRGRPEKENAKITEPPRIAGTDGRGLPGPQPSGPMADPDAPPF